MYRCPFCENFSYDWNDTDPIEVKDETRYNVYWHFKTVHPDIKSSVPENSTV